MNGYSHFNQITLYFLTCQLHYPMDIEVRMCLTV